MGQHERRRKEQVFYPLMNPKLPEYDPYLAMSANHCLFTGIEMVNILVATKTNHAFARNP
jgi:hypothetical protein